MIIRMISTDGVKEYAVDTMSELTEFADRVNFSGSAKVTVIDAESYEILDTKLVSDEAELVNYLKSYLGSDNVIVKVKAHAPKTAAAIKTVIMR